MKDIKLVIFDLDGTLINAYPAIISSFNYTMQKAGYPPETAQTIKKAVGWGDKNLLKGFIDKADLDRALSIYRKHHQQALLKGSRLFPKVRMILSYLQKKGYSLAVASNRPSRFSRILLKHLKLDKYFDLVLCADKLEHPKPHPQILRVIMKKLEVMPKDTIFVGDMAIDAQAGRRGRVKTIIVTTGSSSRQEISKEKPFKIIKSLGEIVRYL